MSSISGISGGINTSRIQPQIGSREPTQVRGVTIHERFNFPELELPEREHSDIVPEERLNYNVLRDLFLEIIQRGVDIIPTKPRDHGSFVVEASFRPPRSAKMHSSIQIPLRGTNHPLIAPNPNLANRGLRSDVVAYIKPIINNSTDADIIRLIIVIAHEFGHYVSYSRGFHDAELKLGIEIFASKQLSAETGRYTWLVFREECMAWRYGADTLKKCSFNYWAEYDKVKNHGLQIYYKELKLELASLEVYYKLSMLGDDFINNNQKVLFSQATNE